MNKRALPGVILAALLPTGVVLAQPAAQYIEAFHIAPIGRWNSSTVADLRTRLLADQGGVEPRYVNLAMCEATGVFLESTQGRYYDYIYEPSTNSPNPADDRGWELDRIMKVAQSTGMPIGSHVNGMPWGDAWDQSVDMLHNFLEIYDAGDGPGSFLQRDRVGRFRSNGVTDPTINERTDQLGALEMHVTLSPYATMVRQYWERNLRQAVRLSQYQRDLNPDLVLFLSGSSEVGQNIHANVDFSDYSRWSTAEFRDWLLGRGIYTGRGQFANVAALNAAFGAGSPGTGGLPAGFPLTESGFEAMTPPTNTDAPYPQFNPNSRRGRWFLKWHEFRVHQVASIVARQGEISVECGWNPDRVFGHQVPDKPIPTDGSPIPDPGPFAALYAAPYTTTFAPLMGNGITTYQDSADEELFQILRAQDPQWGIFEYNPIFLNDGVASPGTIEFSRTALEAVRTAKGHIISPYLWDGGLTGALAVYTIRTRPFEQAMREYINEHGNTPINHLRRWEANPESRSHLWPMNRISEVAGTSNSDSLAFNSGILSGTTTSTFPRVTLALPTAGIEAIEYGELAARIEVDRSSTGAFIWSDADGTEHVRTFAVQAGWNHVVLNLAEAPGWRQGAIQSLSIQPTSRTASPFRIAWAKLTPTFSWPMNEAGEISGPSGFAAAPTVTNGTLTATDNSGDGFFFLSTDKPAWTDADRVVIDADNYRKLEVEITASAAGNAQVFWWRRGTSFFQSGLIPVAAGSQRLQIDLGNEPEWRGGITQFRLDPVNSAGVSVTINSVRLMAPLLRPVPAVDDIIINTEFPRLLWHRALEAEPVTHEVEIARDFDFANPVVQRAGLTGGVYTHDGSPRLPNGDYWWRVRSRGATSGAASDWSYPMPLRINKWRFDDVRDLYDSSAPISFRTNDMTVPTASGGILSAQAANTDGDFVLSPFFYFNSGGDRGRGINASVYTRLRFRIRMSGGTGPAGTPQIFFFSDETNNYHSIVLPNMERDGQWRVVEVNMANAPQWRGNIRLLRLDPTFDRGIYRFDLDWAEVAPTGAPILEDPTPSQWMVY